MKKIPMILLAMFTLSGCDRQEMIYSFNHVEEASVDNEVENTESVDNIQAETEQAVDITTEEPEISDVYSGPTVTLAMVGDVLLHTPVEESCQAEDGSYDFSSLFANVKDEVQAADIAIVNQEVIIGGEELGVSGYPSFNAPYEVADALAETGFDVILHGTNHAMDQGKKGITNCLSNWEKKYPDIKILGINKSQDAAGYHYRFRAEWNKNCGIKLYIWSEWHCTAFGYAVCSKSSGRRKSKSRYCISERTVRFCCCVSALGNRI